MDEFIGRKQERQEFAELLTRKKASLVTCQGRRHIGPKVIDEVREKVARLKLPKSQSVRTVLIHSGELDSTIEPSDYFDFIINADEWVAG
ncbi:MAG: hypothetical protein ABI600_11405 [Luteolibacter sp.]